MADSKKTTVVIASVLKPVDDSRMYEKIGLTLADSGRYEVHVIGVASAASHHPCVTQHAFKPFRRLSLRRWLAPWRILFLTLRLRPRLLIITTHELLHLALFLKLIRRCRVIYDVQENYYWNILYTRAFPLLLRPVIALYVRGKETLAARYIDHFLLAERGYEQELKFPGDRYTVIENKLRLPPEERHRPPFDSKQDVIRLLFSGTIAETTGVFTAIEMAIRLHVIDDRIRLTIIGYCAQGKVLDKLRLLTGPRPFIQLIARDRPVPHAEIFDHIRKSDFGMVTYQINPSTINTIPTKLYEYAGFRLPMLLVNHRPWVDFCRPWSAAVVFDPDQYDAADLLRGMLTRTFYPSAPLQVYWQTEEPRLLEAISRALD